MGGISLTSFGFATSAPGYRNSNSISTARRSNENIFGANLEKRIRDYRSGRHDHLDSLVDREIAARDNSVTIALSSSDPTALKSYTSLLSGLTYDRSARVVAGVEHTVRTLSNIPSEEEAQAQTDKLLEQLGRK